MRSLANANSATRRFTAVRAASLAVKVAAVALLIVLAAKFLGGV